MFVSTNRGNLSLMRLVTFNVLHGRSPEDGRVDIDRFAAAVKSLDTDVLALQEVDHNQPRSANSDLTAVAAESMGARDQRFVAAMSGTPGATWSAATGQEQPDATAYGIALLSRYPVTAWKVLRLPVPPVRLPMWFRSTRRLGLVRDEPRVAVTARVRTPRGELTVANTHLSFVPGWGRHQLRTLVRSLGETRPLVLMGDLNMSPAAATAATRMEPLATARTFPSEAPTRQLDHVLARGLEAWVVSGSGARRLPVSDHRALVADLD